jgi:hypothetical protein
LVLRFVLWAGAFLEVPRRPRRLFKSAHFTFTTGAGFFCIATSATAFELKTPA